jgi:hypothetical protein
MISSARRSGKQIFLAVDLPGDGFQLAVAAEKGLMEALKEDN